MEAWDSVCQIHELTYLIRHANECLHLWRFATWKFIYKGFTLFLLFHLLFCLVGSSLFSSWWSWLKVCQFCYLSKNRFLVLLVFSIFFPTISYVIFIISFLLLTLGFILLFLILSGGTLGFSFFLKKAYISMKFPLKNAFGASHRFWKAVLPFSFVLRYFLASCQILWLIHFLLRYSWCTILYKLQV